eukprot:9947181-Ditylum_brightwellii.AAC.1
MKYENDEGELMYKGKLGDGTFDLENVTHEWVQRNFGENFTEYYYKLQDPELYNQWIKVPEGFSPNIGEQTVVKHEKLQRKITNIFDGPPMEIDCSNEFNCAFSNI